jgi:hypothetical protein
MMLKVGNEFVRDFTEDVDVEKISRVFEEISFTYGDYSYQFELNATTPNLDLLGLPALVDLADKPIYNTIDAALCDDEGYALFYGQLRVENVDIDTKRIICSFFSGNYNWIAQLTGNVNDLNLSEYDTELDITNISNSWLNTSGLVFPLIDTGTLITRSYRTITPADFNGCFYVKTLFEKIFWSVGIKFDGDLVNDFVFNNLIICNNSASCYVQKTSTTSQPLENTQYKITFDNDSVYPYFDGDDDAFDLANSRWIAPYDMTVEVEVGLEPDIDDSSYSNRIYIYINGSFTFVDIGLSIGGLYNTARVGGDLTVYKQTIQVSAGDIVEVYGEWQQSSGSTANDIVSGYWKMTPKFIFNVKGSSVVPTWTKQEFVANILNLFNVVSHYNPLTKVVTFNFFDKIKTKTAVDLSPYIQINSVDYSEFISNYAKRNVFAYEEGEDEEIRDYNVTKFIKYGAGEIEVDNDFIEDTTDVIQSKFKTPISYLNGPFGCSLERVNFMEIDESDEVDFTSVTDSSGNARFNTANNAFLVGDLVRIKECDLNEYKGDWRVSARDVTYFELQGVPFQENAVGKASKATRTPTSSDDVFLFINLPNYSVPNLSERTTFNFPSAINPVSSISYAYFNILENGQTINTQYEQGLSFGEVDSPFSYQRTLLETYWRNFASILSDPVKLKVTAHLPKAVYLSLTPLTPVYIKHDKTTNLFYINRNTGYKSSDKPCYLELIKL